MNENEIRNQFVEFFKAHKISSPHGRPVGAMDGQTLCSCGARWHTFYTQKGLQWHALNAQCEAHDTAQAALPEGYGLDEEGQLFEART